MGDKAMPTMPAPCATDEFDIAVGDEVARVLSDKTPPATPPSLHPSSRDSLYQTLPFDPAAVEGSGINLQDCTFMVVPEGQARELLLRHVADNLDHAGRSFLLDERGEKPSVGPRLTREEQRKRKKQSGVSTVAGFGLSRFLWYQDAKPITLHCLRQYVGSPVGTNCGPSRMENIVLFGPGLSQQGLLKNLIDELIAASQATAKNTFTIYQWHVKYQYWQRNQTVRARPLESVILPRATKEKLCKDIDDFVSEDTEEFYFQHGIPYKRSYLFHGLPGSGKTSLIQAIAGHYSRNLCFLQPTHPEMTDDSLRAAVNEAPMDSIIVLEDIDALFDKHRGKKISQSPLTFSGLLNALDGVGNPQGQIFVLTTNFREQLDSALIRNGRVDLHVEFAPTTGEQMEDMFAAFYPAEASQAARFSEALITSLEDRVMSTAALQHFFVTQRKCTAEEAIENVPLVAAAIDERAKEATAKEATTEGEPKNEEGGNGALRTGKGKRNGGQKLQKKNNAGMKSGRGHSSGSGGQVIHVHVHNEGGSGCTNTETPNEPDCDSEEEEAAVAAAYADETSSGEEEE